MADVICALQRFALSAPERIAFADDQNTVSYGILARRVAGTFEALKDQDTPIGLLAENSIDWVIADLALTATGRRFVPLPPFFSDTQLAHVVQDSGLNFILCDRQNADRAARLSNSAQIPKQTASISQLDSARPGQRVIYTSGSTGRPKGVQLGDRQLDFISKALANAISASDTDRYLSILPFPLLLEELCGIHVPIMVGGSCTIKNSVAPACMNGDLDAIRRAFDDVNPTVSVLVPELLRAWVGALMLGNYHAPQSLRAVAIGGAPVPPQVLQAGLDLGVPCIEGYGLSECGSVVAVNRPGEMSAGTVGKPLEGLTVEIDDGEIVVAGPSVMDGYLGGGDQIGRWRTGDLGHFDSHGNLIIEGRKDALIVTGYGRNIQPEWIEARFQGDPRILRAILTGHGQSYPTLLLVPGTFAGNFFETCSSEMIFQALDGICTDTPAYARPSAVIVTSNDELQNLGLLSPNGRIRRQALQAWLSTTDAQVRLIARSEEKEPIA